MRPITRLVSGASALSLLLLSLVFVVPAHAGHVGCGSTILVSTVLDSDVGPCDEGITIGADNITFDLGGRTIRGIGGSANGEGPGILLAGRTGVRVVNGRVRDFDAGVVIEGGSGNTVERMSILDNIGSLSPLGTILGDGILIDQSNNNRVQFNQVVHNGPLSGVTVFGGGRGNVISRNEVANNNLVARTSGDHGIRLEPRAVGNTVSNNRITGSGLDAISIFPFSTDNRIVNNAVIGNGFHNLDHRKGDGITVLGRASRNLIEGNQVFNNAANGIFVDGPRGSTIAGATNNLILANRTGGNNRQPQGTPDFDLRDDNFQPPCDANTWRGNTFGTFNQPCVTAQ